MDDLERQLRDLGDSAGRDLEGEHLVPHPDVPRRAIQRRISAGFGAAALSVAVAAGAFMGFTAMGGRAMESAEPSVLAAAAQATELQGTARTSFEMTAHTDMGALGQTLDLTMTGEGEIDFQKSLSRSTFTMSSGQISAFTIESIQDGSTTYSKGAPGTEGWVKQEMPSSAGGFGGQDVRPDDYLDYLHNVSSVVEVAGIEEIDGVEVTHYRAVLDDELLADSYSPEATKTLDELETESEPLDVWIDGQGLVRKISMDSVLSGRIGENGFTSDLSVTMSYYDFGVPVDIELPDEAEITEAAVADEASPSPEPDSSPGAPSVEGFFLFSEDRVEAPRALIGLDPPGFCVFRLPEWVTTAELVVEGLDQVILTIGGSDLSDTKFGRIGCIYEGMPDGLDELESEPDSLILRLIGESQTEDVEIVEAYRS